jgi:hypothetical protein
MWRMSRIPARPMRPEDITLMAVCFGAAVVLSVGVFLYGMRSGVKALDEMG